MDFEEIFVLTLKKKENKFDIFLDALYKILDHVRIGLLILIS